MNESQPDKSPISKIKCGIKTFGESKRESHFQTVGIFQKDFLKVNIVNSECTVVIFFLGVEGTHFSFLLSKAFKNQCPSSTASISTAFKRYPVNHSLKQEREG